MGGQPKCMQRNIDKRICLICDTRTPDTALHILLECNALSDVRNVNLLKFKKSMPLVMSICFQGMSREEKLRFLLSPLLSSYIPEWRQVYEAIASMVYALYATRANLYDALPSCED